MKFVYFLNKKALSSIFLFFPPMWARKKILLFIFFSTDEGKKTLVGARQPNNILSVALWTLISMFSVNPPYVGGPQRRSVVHNIAL